MTAYTTIDWLHAPASLLDGRRFVARFRKGTVVDGYLTATHLGVNPYVSMLDCDEDSLGLCNLRILTINETPPRTTILNPLITSLTVTMQTREDRQ